MPPNARSAESATRMNSYGADFVKKVRPLGAVIILLISVLSIIMMFTADVTPITDIEPEPETEQTPQEQIVDTEYYYQYVEYNIIDE